MNSEYPDSSASESFFHIIPVPLEPSELCSYGTGSGPSAILRASQHMESWDGKSEPGCMGLHTVKPLTAEGGTYACLDRIKKTVSRSLKTGKCPIILGGEHTVSIGAFQALSEMGEEVGIIQFDAHGDLKENHEGNPYHPVCTMKRALDLKLPVFQVGIRSISQEELWTRERLGIQHLDAEKAVTENITRLKLPEKFPKKIYISFDVDGLDPSVIPCTGSPVPGGLGWYQTLGMIESLARTNQIIGFDITELAPVEGQYSSDFAAARLAYNIMGIIERNLEGNKHESMCL